MTEQSPSDLYTLGARRFGSEHWAGMAQRMDTTLQRQGEYTAVPLTLLANLTWEACMEAWGPETAHGADKHCTRKVVGCIVWYDNKMALQERLTGAIGVAPSAGHLEKTEGAAIAVLREVDEEMGLTLVDCTLIGQGQRFEYCKRYGSDGHYWYVFEGLATGEVLKLNPDESKHIAWYEPFQVLELVARTEAYLRQQISEADWRARPGLEIVWYWWFVDLGVIDCLRKLAAAHEQEENHDINQ